MGLFDPVLAMHSCHGCCCCLVWCGSPWTPDRALADLRTRFLRGRWALCAAWFARCCLKLVLLSVLDDPAIFAVEPSDEPLKRGYILRIRRDETRLRVCWFRGAARRNKKNALLI